MKFIVKGVGSIIKLRPYQEEAINVMKSTSPNEPSLVVIPTGGGKGVLFSHIANQTNGRVLIVVPSEELLKQGIQKIKQGDPLADVGKVQGIVNQLDSKIIVGTRQSLSHKKSTRLERMLEHGEVEYVILDESHQAVDQLDKIVSKLNGQVKVIGMTATPFNPKMKRLFKGISYEKPILSMVEDEYLCEPKAIKVYTETDLSKVKTSRGDFQQDQLEDAVNNTERNETVVKAYQEYASGRISTIVFCVGINHAEEITRMFNENGIEAACVHSGLDKKVRADILERYEQGRLPVIVNVNVLSTGYDVPRTDCILMARPTKSKILYVQCLGRGLRLSEGKEDMLLIDITDNVKSFDLMSIDDVFGVKFKNGERLLEAKANREREQAEEEERKREEERERQEEIRLHAEQVELFKRKNILSIDEELENHVLDWFKVGSNMIALTYNDSRHYIIRFDETGTLFEVFDLDLQLKRKSDSTYYDDLKSALDSVSVFIRKVGVMRYISKTVSWKSNPPSAKQLLSAPNAQTSGEASKIIAASWIMNTLDRMDRLNLN